MLAASVFNQNNGDVTKTYYASMAKKGFHGMLAVALFRAQKRSTAAKRYRGKDYKSAAYDVKNWSLSQVCTVLQSWGFGFEWGWKIDRNTPGFNWVLYVDLPTGQCSFHSRERLEGPSYTGCWNPGDGSEAAILRYCDSIWDPTYNDTPADRAAVIEEAKQAQLEF